MSKHSFEKRAAVAAKASAELSDVSSRRDVETLKLLAGISFAQVFGEWPGRVDSVTVGIPARVRISHEGHRFVVYVDPYDGLKTHPGNIYVTWEGVCPLCHMVSVSEGIDSLGIFGRMLATGFEPGSSHYIDGEGACDPQEPV